MCDLMVRGARFYEIKDGLVLSHSVSGGDTFCWPIVAFRTMLAEGSALLRQFDADHRVIEMAGH